MGPLNLLLLLGILGRRTNHSYLLLSQCQIADEEEEEKERAKRATASALYSAAVDCLRLC